jgi:hypothetical protein
MSLSNLSVQQLRKAANLKEQIDNLHKQLAAISSSTGVSAPSKPAKSVKGKMSAGHIAKIRAAQKLRWSKFRAGKSAAKTAAVKPGAAPKKKGTISAAGIARIKAAQKARWAAIKAAKAKPVAKPVKKARKKFTMSAAAKAKLSALAKARWAKVKATGKKKL